MIENFGRNVGKTMKLAMLGCLLLGGASGCASTLGTNSAPATSAVLSQSQQQAMTPDQVVEALKAGNKRFASGQLTQRDYLAQAKVAAKGQYPMAVVLSCLDSRIPPEIVFDRGIGDLFVARVAGNFENTDILGSMEFATKLAGAKVVVALGHTSCGAVKGACDGAQLGNLTSTLANIEPALQASSSVEGKHDSHNPAFVASVTRANVRQTMADIVERSAVIKDLIAAGQLVIVGGIYDLDTGAITWLER